LSNTAITRGKPALTVESGALAGTDEESIARIERGATGVMRHLGMVTDGPAPVTSAVWLEPGEVLRAGHTGILYPVVERGHSVARDALLAYITDYFGTRVEEIRAPFDGEVMYVVATPAISAGEPVAFVAARATGTPAAGPAPR
jgi:predicted deacylase